MAFNNRIMASGIAPLAAQNITGDVSAALTASGTTKATALQLSSAENYIAICSSGKAVALPAMNQGDDCSVFNNGSNSLLVFTTPGSSDVITNNSSNAGFTIAAQKGANFNKVTSTVVMVNYSA